MKLPVLFLVLVASNLSPLHGLRKPDHTFGDLKMVALLFRHGARTPDSPYPNDIHANFTWDGLARGALTSVGIKQLYEHGTWLGNTYKPLLAKEGMFRQYNLQAKSSIAERCIMSGLSFLAGFYPPNQDANPLSIEWQPVPVYPIPIDVDYYLTGMACAKSLSEFQRFLQNPPDDVKQMFERDSEMLSVFKEQTGQQTMNLYDIVKIFDAIKVQGEWDLTRPSWFQPSYFDRFEDYVQRFMDTFTETPEMKILKSGPLITEILDSMDKAKSSAVYKKVFMYAAHDMTLISMARALEIEKQIPRVLGYGATFALEFYRTGDIDEIRIKFYATGDRPNFVNIDIPNCPQPCPLETFKSQYANLIVRDIVERCKQP